MESSLLEREASGKETLDKSRARHEIAETLYSIWDMANHMPVLESGSGKSKMDPTDKGYYDFKIVQSVFGIVRKLMDSIIDKRLVTNAHNLNLLTAEYNELATLIHEIMEVREGMKKAGKSEEEIRAYLNNYGEDQNNILDRIIVKIIGAFKEEETSSK